MAALQEFLTFHVLLPATQWIKFCIVLKRAAVYFIHCLVDDFVHILGWHCCYLYTCNKKRLREKVFVVLKKMAGLCQPPLLALCKMYILVLYLRKVFHVLIMNK